MGIVDVSAAGVSSGVAQSFSELGTVFGVVFSSSGFPSLFADPSKILLVLITIFAFSMTDIFDTIGTFIGTGRKTGIFDEEDEKAMLSSKMCIRDRP